MPEWIKSKPLLFAAVLMSIVMLTLVIYGVTTHKEAGLMFVCWDHSGDAVYEDCDNRESLVWPRKQLPITIAVVTDHSFDEIERVRAIRLVTGAANLWNEQIGVRLFRIVGENDDASTRLHWGIPMMVGSGHDKDGGYVTHRKDVDGYTSSRANIYYTATDGLASAILFHELGHVIGLAHDDFKASPMYPSTEDTEEVRFRRVTDFDRSVLKATYGSK